VTADLALQSLHQQVPICNLQMRLHWHPRTLIHALEFQLVKTIRYDLWSCCGTNPHTVTKISRKDEYCPPSLSYPQPSHSLPLSPCPSRPWPPPPPEAAPPPPHGLFPQPEAAACIPSAARGNAQAGHSSLRASACTPSSTRDPLGATPSEGRTPQRNMTRRLAPEHDDKKKCIISSALVLMSLVLEPSLRTAAQWRRSAPTHPAPHKQPIRNAFIPKPSFLHPPRDPTKNPSTTTR